MSSYPRLFSEFRIGTLELYPHHTQLLELLKAAVADTDEDLRTASEWEVEDWKQEQRQRYKQMKEDQTKILKAKESEENINNDGQLNDPVNHTSKPPQILPPVAATSRGISVDSSWVNVTDPNTPNLGLPHQRPPTAAPSGGTNYRSSSGNATSKVVSPLHEHDNLKTSASFQKAPTLPPSGKSGSASRPNLTLTLGKAPTQGNGRAVSAQRSPQLSKNTAKGYHNRFNSASKSSTHEYWAHEGHEEGYDDHHHGVGEGVGNSHTAEPDHEYFRRIAAQQGGGGANGGAYTFGGGNAAGVAESITAGDGWTSLANSDDDGHKRVSDDSIELKSVHSGSEPGANTVQPTVQPQKYEPVSVPTSVVTPASSLTSHPRRIPVTGITRKSPLLSTSPGFNSAPTSSIPANRVQKSSALTTTDDTHAATTSYYYGSGTQKGVRNRGFSPQPTMPVAPQQQQQQTYTSFASATTAANPNDSATATNTQQPRGVNNLRKSLDNFHFPEERTFKGKDDVQPGQRRGSADSDISDVSAETRASFPKEFVKGQTFSALSADEERRKKEQREAVERMSRKSNKSGSAANTVTSSQPRGTDGNRNKSPLRGNNRRGQGDGEDNYYNDGGMTENGDEAFGYGGEYIIEENYDGESSELDLFNDEQLAAYLPAPPPSITSGGLILALRVTMVFADAETGGGAVQTDETYFSVDRADIAKLLSIYQLDTAEEQSNEDELDKLNIPIQLRGFAVPSDNADENGPKQNSCRQSSNLYFSDADVLQGDKLLNLELNESFLIASPVLCQGIGEAGAMHRNHQADLQRHQQKSGKGSPPLGGSLNRRHSINPTPAAELASKVRDEKLADSPSRSSNRQRSREDNTYHDFNRTANSNHTLGSNADPQKSTAISPFIYRPAADRVRISVDATLFNVPTRLPNNTPADKIAALAAVKGYLAAAHELSCEMGNGLDEKLFEKERREADLASAKETKTKKSAADKTSRRHSKGKASSPSSPTSPLTNGPNAADLNEIIFHLRKREILKPPVSSTTLTTVVTTARTKYSDPSAAAAAALEASESNSQQLQQQQSLGGGGNFFAKINDSGAKTTTTRSVKTEGYDHTNDYGDFETLLEECRQGKSDVTKFCKYESELEDNLLRVRLLALEVDGGTVGGSRNTASFDSLVNSGRRKGPKRSSSSSTSESSVVEKSATTPSDSDSGGSEQGSPNTRSKDKSPTKRSRHHHDKVNSIKGDGNTDATGATAGDLEVSNGFLFKNCIGRSTTLVPVTVVNSQSDRKEFKTFLDHKQNSKDGKKSRHHSTSATSTTTTTDVTTTTRSTAQQPLMSILKASTAHISFRIASTKVSLSALVGVNKSKARTAAVTSMPVVVSLRPQLSQGFKLLPNSFKRRFSGNSGGNLFGISQIGGGGEEPDDENEDLNKSQQRAFSNDVAATILLHFCPTAVLYPRSLQNEGLLKAPSHLPTHLSSADTSNVPQQPSIVCQGELFAAVELVTQKTVKQAADAVLPNSTSSHPTNTALSVSSAAGVVSTTVNNLSPQNSGLTAPLPTPLLSSSTDALASLSYAALAHTTAIVILVDLIHLMHWTRPRVNLALFFLMCLLCETLFGGWDSTEPTNGLARYQEESFGPLSGEQSTVQMNSSVRNSDMEWDAFSQNNFSSTQPSSKVRISTFKRILSFLGEVLRSLCELFQTPVFVLILELSVYVATTLVTTRYLASRWGYAAHLHALGRRTVKARLLGEQRRIFEEVMGITGSGGGGVTSNLKFDFLSGVLGAICVQKSLQRKLERRSQRAQDKATRKAERLALRLQNKRHYESDHGEICSELSSSDTSSSDFERSRTTATSSQTYHTASQFGGDDDKGVFVTTGEFIPTRHTSGTATSAFHPMDPLYMSTYSSYCGVPLLYLGTPATPGDVATVAKERMAETGSTQNVSIGTPQPTYLMGCISYDATFDFMQYAAAVESSARRYLTLISLVGVAVDTQSPVITTAGETIRPAAVSARQELTLLRLMIQSPPRRLVIRWVLFTAWIVMNLLYGGTALHYIDCLSNSIDSFGTSVKLALAPQVGLVRNHTFAQSLNESAIREEMLKLYGNSTTEGSTEFGSTTLSNNTPELTQTQRIFRSISGNCTKQLSNGSWGLSYSPFCQSLARNESANKAHDEYMKILNAQYATYPDYVAPFLYAAIPLMTFSCSFVLQVVSFFVGSFPHFVSVSEIDSPNFESASPSFFAMVITTMLTTIGTVAVYFPITRRYYAVKFQVNRVKRLISDQLAIIAADEARRLKQATQMRREHRNEKKTRKRGAQLTNEEKKKIDAEHTADRKRESANRKKWFLLNVKMYFLLLKVFYFWIVRWTNYERSRRHHFPSLKRAANTRFGPNSAILAQNTGNDKNLLPAEVESLRRHAHVQAHLALAEIFGQAVSENRAKEEERARKTLRERSKFKKRHHSKSCDDVDDLFPEVDSLEAPLPFYLSHLPVIAVTVTRRRLSLSNGKEGIFFNRKPRSPLTVANETASILTKAVALLSLQMPCPNAKNCKKKSHEYDEISTHHHQHIPFSWRGANFTIKGLLLLRMYSVNQWQHRQNVAHRVLLSLFPSRIPASYEEPQPFHPDQPTFMHMNSDFASGLLQSPPSNLNISHQPPSGAHNAQSVSNNAHTSGALTAMDQFQNAIGNRQQLQKVSPNGPMTPSPNTPTVGPTTSMAAVTGNEAMNKRLLSKGTSASAFAPASTVPLTANTQRFVGIQTANNNEDSYGSNKTALSPFESGNSRMNLLNSTMVGQPTGDRSYSAAELRDNSGEQNPIRNAGGLSTAAPSPSGNRSNLRSSSMVVQRQTTGSSYHTATSTTNNYFNNNNRSTQDRRHSAVRALTLELDPPLIVTANQSTSKDELQQHAESSGDQSTAPGGNLSSKRNDVNSASNRFSNNSTPWFMGRNTLLQTQTQQSGSYIPNNLNSHSDGIHPLSDLNGTNNAISSPLMRLSSATSPSPNPQHNTNNASSNSPQQHHPRRGGDVSMFNRRLSITPTTPQVQHHWTAVNSNNQSGSLGFNHARTDSRISAPVSLQQLQSFANLATTNSFGVTGNASSMGDQIPHAVNNRHRRQPSGINLQVSPSQAHLAGNAANNLSIEQHNHSSHNNTIGALAATAPAPSSPRRRTTMPARSAQYPLTQQNIELATSAGGALKSQPTATNFTTTSTRASNNARGTAPLDTPAPPHLSESVLRRNSRSQSVSAGAAAHVAPSSTSSSRMAPSLPTHRATPKQ